MVLLSLLLSLLLCDFCFFFETFFFHFLPFESTSDSSLLSPFSFLLNSSLLSLLSLLFSPIKISTFSVLVAYTFVGTVVYHFAVTESDNSSEKITYAQINLDFLSSFGVTIFAYDVHTIFDSCWL